MYVPSASVNACTAFRGKLTIECGHWEILGQHLKQVLTGGKPVHAHGLLEETIQKAQSVDAIFGDDKWCSSCPYIPTDVSHQFLLRDVVFHLFNTSFKLHVVTTEDTKQTLTRLCPHEK